MARNTTVFLHDYLEEMSALTDEEFGRLCRMLLRFSIYGEIPEPVGNERFFIHRVISVEENLQRRYAERCEKNRAAINARWHKQASEIKCIQADTKAYECIQADTKDTNTNTNSNTNSNSNTKRENIKREKDERTKPTLEEVTDYCRQRGNSINPQAFLDYYEQQGWRLANGNKLKDWRAAVRTWEQREAKRSEGKPRRPYGSGPVSTEDNDRALRQMQRLMDEMQGGS